MNDRRKSTLPHERLDAYHVAIELIAVLSPVFEASVAPSLRDQLRRAGTSVALNIAEASGRSGRDRQNFYRIARGSCLEVAAVLDVIGASGFDLGGVHDLAHDLCDRLYAMLTRMSGVHQTSVA